MEESYENDEFEKEEEASPSRQPEVQEAKHVLRLMIDLKSVKDLKSAANLFLQYQLTLQGKTQGFKSNPPTPVGISKEAQIQNSFQSFQFQSGKGELQQLL